MKSTPDYKSNILHAISLFLLILSFVAGACIFLFRLFCKRQLICIFSLTLSLSSIVHTSSPIQPDGGQIELHFSWFYIPAGVFHLAMGKLSLQSIKHLLYTAGVMIQSILVVIGFVYLDVLQVKHINGHTWELIKIIIFAFYILLFPWYQC